MARFLNQHGVTSNDLSFFREPRAVGQRWLGVDYYPTCEHRVSSTGRCTVTHVDGDGLPPPRDAVPRAVPGADLPLRDEPREPSRRRVAGPAVVGHPRDARVGNPGDGLHLVLADRPDRLAARAARRAQRSARGGACTICAAASALWAFGTRRSSPNGARRSTRAPTSPPPRRSARSAWAECAGARVRGCAGARVRDGQRSNRSNCNCMSRGGAENAEDRERSWREAGWMRTPKSSFCGRGWRGAVHRRRPTRPGEQFSASSAPPRDDTIARETSLPRVQRCEKAVLRALGSFPALSA